MGFPHLFDSPISYPAPHEAEVRSRGYASVLVKEARRFSFLNSPQMSIAAIAALQLEPRRAIVPSFRRRNIGPRARLVGH